MLELQREYRAETRQTKVSNAKNEEIMLSSKSAECNRKKMKICQRTRGKRIFEPIKNPSSFEQDIIIKFLFVGDRSIIEMHLRQIRFT